jgi:uncharacterized protein with WD repeat
VTCEKYTHTPDNLKIWDINTCLLEGSHEWTSSIKDSIKYIKWSKDDQYMARTKATQSKSIQIFNTLISLQDVAEEIELEKISFFDFIP